MSDAAAAAAAATAAQPAPWRPDLAAAKALGLLCLAGLSVGFAAGGAAVVTIAACDYDEPCPVYRVLAATSIRAIVLAALLAPIAPLLVVRAAVCDPGFREELIVGLIRHLQAPRAPAGSMLHEAVVRAFLAALAFLLLSAIGCLVLVVLSPAKGSPTGRIGAMLAVVGEVGSAAISCFIVFPLMALKLWRMKFGGAAVADSNV
ncbi:hypothetical protein SETIT_6G148500v2 [Setaria italica]|uniref:Uncharacterized protein n=1 Tax=Setaria italica TaxID=4555 RepID=A0A368RLK7_SETIT|nr:hypothetical protein SETIT_6G148500v2 [Setaria italica]